MVSSVTGEDHMGLNPNMICKVFFTMPEELYLLLIAVYICKKNQTNLKLHF